MSGLRTWTVRGRTIGAPPIQDVVLEAEGPALHSREKVPVVAIADLVEALTGDEALVLLLDCLDEAGWHAATEVEMVEAIDMGTVVAKAKADLSGALVAALTSLGLDVEGTTTCPECGEKPDPETGVIRHRASCRALTITEKGS